MVVMIEEIEEFDLISIIIIILLKIKNYIINENIIYN